MKSTCCSAEIFDDWDVWRCSECKKSLAYNTFRGNSSFESQINEKKLTKERLLKKLKEINGNDEEKNHIAADRLLLEYVNDEEIKEAFNSVKKRISRD